MATIDYSAVPAVVTITATADVKVPFSVPNFSIDLAKDDVLKVVANSSAELAYYKELANAIDVTVTNAAKS